MRESKIKSDESPTTLKMPSARLKTRYYGGIIFAVSRHYPSPLVIFDTFVDDQGTDLAQLNDKAYVEMLGDFAEFEAAQSVTDSSPVHVFLGYVRRSKAGNYSLEGESRPFDPTMHTLATLPNAGMELIRNRVRERI